MTGPQCTTFTRGRVATFAALSILSIVLCSMPASAAPAGNQMCGDGTTFHVDLPALYASPDLLGLDALLGDSIDVPQGCDLYVLIVSDVGRNRWFNELLLYPLAKFAAEHNGYVHYAWWNNLLTPYLGGTVHKAVDLFGNIIGPQDVDVNNPNSPGLRDGLTTRLDSLLKSGFGSGFPDLGNALANAFKNTLNPFDFTNEVMADVGVYDTECKYNSQLANPVAKSILSALGRAGCAIAEGAMANLSYPEWDLTPFPHSADQFVVDAAKFVKRTREENPHAVIVVVGHGLGGHAAGLVAEQLSQEVRPDSPGPASVIDLLALIDPYASDGVDGSIVDSSLFSGSRARSVTPLRGWSRRDCVRGVLGLCKNFGTLFHPSYSCYTTAEVLKQKPLFGSYAPIHCPGSVEIYHDLFISPAINRFYHRWQNETGPPGDFADLHTYPTSATTGLPSVLAQAPVPTCSDPASVDPFFQALAALATTDPTNPSDPASLLNCSPYDGHDELVGFRGYFSTVPNQDLDLAQLAGGLPVLGAVLNALGVNDPAAVDAKVTLKIPAGVFALHWPTQIPDPNHLRNFPIDFSAPDRRSAMMEMATPDPLNVWSHSPFIPQLCLVCDDLIAITTDLLVGNGSIGSDTTPPVTAAIDHPGANPAGWHAADVEVDLTAGDAGSGVKQIDHALSGAQSSGDVATPGASAQETITTEGTTTVSYFATDNAGNVETPKTLDVKLDKTPPDVSASPDRGPNARGWYNADAVVTFNASDALSGVASVAPPITVSSEGANQEAIGSATDNAGNTAAGSVLVSIDKTPPAIALASRLPAPNANGWNRTDVTLTWNCTDALSGPVSPTVSQSVVAEGLAQTATGTCFDAADNAASDVQVNVNIDKTPPAIVGSRSPSANVYGWNNSPVTVGFTCTDALSGLAAGSPPAPTTRAVEGANQSVLGTCADRADNTASVSVQGINIDLTAPAITITASSSTLWPPNGNLVPDTISGVISDALSGIDPTTLAFQVIDQYGVVQPTGPISLGPDGTYSFTVMLEASRLGQDLNGRQYQIVVSAQDKAGNPATASTIVTVPHDLGK